MYRERMYEYYPQVIRDILEFQGIVDAEYPEFELGNGEVDSLVNDAYFSTMGEERIKQWEKVFKITPPKDSTLDDRREVIVARVRGQGKLNSKMISAIVNAFTGGTAKSYIEDSKLRVYINPPSPNKEYNFDNVRQELLNRIPAHLDLFVSRNYITWGNLPDGFEDWGQVASFALSDENGVLTRVDGTYEVSEDGMLKLYATWGDIAKLTPHLLGVPET